MTASAFVVLGAGIMAAFNPCGVAMLPSYILNLLAGRERRIWDGLWAGILMTTGFLVIFLLAGIVSLAFAAALGKISAWIAFILGILFAIMGILMLFGKNGISFHIGGNWRGKPGTNRSIFLYGIAYALGSLGCTLPLFSVLVLSSFHTQGASGGLVDFLLYALGMGFAVTVISLGSTISQNIVSEWVRKSARWMGKLSGVIALGTGVYLIVYWVPYIRLYAGF